jgi:putative multiple sugar transport system substrate-binding protein
MSKKIFVFLSLLLTASMVLAACGQAATPTSAPGATTAPQATSAPSAKLAVGIVLPTKNEPRWIQDQTRFQDALQKAGYDVEVLFSENDSAKEKTNVESLITKGVKVLIICPQDASAAASSAEEARAAGVKVISYDRLIRDTDAVDYYVTFDSIAVGAQQAQYLVDHATGTGNPLYLYAGAASDNNAFIFFLGAWGVLQPKIADGTFVIKNSSEAVALQGTKDLTRDQEAKIIGQITTNWDFATAKNLAEANLTATTAADKGNVFILAPNDGTARNIADAFAADKDVKSYYVTGQDAEKASVQYIIDGKQSMTVFKDVRMLVDDAIKAAVALLTGQAPASKGSYNNGKIDVPAIQSPVITVDKNNVQSVLIDGGYYKASDFTGLEGGGAAAGGAPAICSSDAGGCAVVKPGQTVKIGMGAPMTGDNAQFGIDISNGAKLAVSDAGEFQGFKFELVAEDDEGSPEGGASVANKLVSDPTVVAIAGHIFSGATAAAIPIYEKANIPMMSPSATNPDLTKSGSKVFNRLVFTDAAQGRFAAAYLYNVLKVKNLAIMHDGQAYGQGLASVVQDEFGKLGGTVVAFQAITPKESDYSAPLADIASKNPDALYYGGYVAEAVVIINQMKAAGLGKTIFFGCDGTFGQDFLDRTGANGEGAYATALIPAASPAKDKFDAAYLAAYGQPAGKLSPYSWTAYDSAAVLIKTIETVAVKGADGNLYVPRAALVAAVRGITDYQGLSGIVSCVSTGECAKSGPVFYIDKGGKWEQAPSG